MHALIAAAVVAPLVPARGRRPLAVAIAAATLIDLDHALAARSLRTKALLSLPARPPSHSIALALAAGTAAAAAADPVYAWAVSAALVSHLLHDAGDSAAPTPLLWPWAPARQIGRRRQLAGTAAVALGSLLVSRAAARREARASAGADDGGA